MAVLNEMLLMGLDVTVIPIPKTKRELLKIISYTNYDVLISNGCPYILPISEMRFANQTYVNIHPSLLPDLKGMSPIKDAIKQRKPFGATCHLMDDGMDSGPIISQVRFTANRNDLGDCYKQSYKAEAKVFQMAYKRNFIPRRIQ